MRAAVLPALAAVLPNASLADIVLPCTLHSSCKAGVCEPFAGGLGASLIASGDGMPVELVSRLGHFVMLDGETGPATPATFHQAWTDGQTALLTVTEDEILLTIHRLANGTLQAETFQGDCGGNG